MLETLYPIHFRRYTALTVFGPIVDGFAAWLLQHQYTHAYIRQRIWLLAYMDSVLVRRGIDHPRKIEQADWTACRKDIRRRFPYLADSTDALEKYLGSRDLLKPVKGEAISTSARYISEYTRYLLEVRGAAVSTIKQHSSTALEFLAHLNLDKQPARLKSVTVRDLETFLKKISHRFTRQSLYEIVSRLRSFLRFLAVKGEMAVGLDRQIERPRIYREEQLPRALPWAEVQRFLSSIDRSRLVGLRDFTIFLLMAMYGLRAGDVAALTLDNIRWRAAKISISQRKTGALLELPLTDTVATALHKYLKKAPLSQSCRQIFLRLKAPIGPLKTAAISQAFRRWARHGGMELAGPGSCHRIRHSYAVFLLRKGASVKTIGDILGHRTLESTWTYLRLALEDLRDVPLPVPAEPKVRKAVQA